MKDVNKQPEIEIIACEICLAEIPSSGAKTVETDDYVMHFCGLDCYALWQQKNKQTETK